VRPQLHRNRFAQCRDHARAGGAGGLGGCGEAGTQSREQLTVEEGLALHLIARRADLDDVAQKMCCALLTRSGGYRGEAKFTTRLCGVVTNPSRDWRCRKRRIAALTSGWPGSRGWRGNPMRATCTMQCG
jgi:hypothetical protein